MRLQDAELTAFILPFTVVTYYVLLFKESARNALNNEPMQNTKYLYGYTRCKY